MAIYQLPIHCVGDNQAIHQVFSLLSTAVKDIFKGVWTYITTKKNMSESFDFADTTKKMEEMKAEIRRRRVQGSENSGVQDLSKVAPKEKQRIMDIQAEIERLKNIEEQEKKRAQLHGDLDNDHIHDAAVKMENGFFTRLMKDVHANEDKLELGGGRLVAGGFMDLMTQWKKIQEAVAGGEMKTLEDLAKEQLKQQHELNKNVIGVKDAVIKNGMKGIPEGPIPA